MKQRTFSTILLLTAFILDLPSVAQDVPLSSPQSLAQKSEVNDQNLKDDSQKRVEKLQSITIIGDIEEQKKIPGSTFVIGQQELNDHHVTDVQRAIWQAPGIYYQDEDGFGLRPNIGMRGTGVLRSLKITILEDGVPVAPAPYAAPAMHSLPITGRMEAIEIRKGSSSIEYGPNTVAGAINLRSTSIPEESVSSHVRVAVGERYGRRIHMNAGGSQPHIGWLVETYQLGEDGFRHFDDGKTNRLSAQDFVGKLRFNTAKDATRYQEVLLKLNLSGENSAESYLGQTESDFNAKPFHLYPAAQKDNMELKRQALSVRHLVTLSPQLELTTTVYRQNLKRNWYKVEGVKASSDADSKTVNISDILSDPDKYSAEYDVLRGGTSVADALQLRANDRTFYSQGAESVLAANFGSKVRHDLRLGLRYHIDQEDRLQHNDLYQMNQGALALTVAGKPGTGKGNNRIRIGEAFAAYVHDTIEIGSWSLSAGTRLESISLRQEDYGANDPDRKGTPTSKNLKLSEPLPGLGIAYQLTPALTTFVGTHRGFSPPLPGSDKSTKAEKSWNSEAGLRYWTSPLSASFIGFFNQYENILGADTAASGGAGSGELYNGGKARTVGTETAVGTDLGDLLRLGLNLPISLSHTYTDARFETNFQTEFEEWAPEVNKGDYMPFVPHNQVGFGLGVKKRGYPDMRLTGHYQSRTRVKAGGESLDKTEALPERTLIDLNAGYDFKPEQRIFIDITNVTNRTYIAARRPAGVRPGMPRTLWAGMSLSL